MSQQLHYDVALDARLVCQTRRISLLVPGFHTVLTVVVFIAALVGIIARPKRIAEATFALGGALIVIAAGVMSSAQASFSCWPTGTCSSSSWVS